MDYEPFKVSYTAGQPYVGATLSMYPPQGETHMGNFIAWDGKTGKIVWSDKEQFSVWSGALATAGNVGGWAGIGLAAGLTNPTDGLGAVGGYAALRNYSSLGGQLTVFALP